MKATASIAVTLLWTAGCMTHFVSGPARNEIAGRPVAVATPTCSTPAMLFDCRHVGAVRDYLADYLRLNRLPPARGEPASLQATVRIFEDKNVVAVELAVSGATGLAFRAQAQGDTLLRALVRLETLLADRADFAGRIVTREDVTKALSEVGRKELSAEKNTFTYR